MVYLGRQQCERASCFLDGNILRGDIKGINLPDIDPATEDVRFRAGEIKTIDVELKGWSIQSKARKPNTQLEIRLPIKDDYGKMVQAIWKFRGLLTCKQDTLTLATTLKLGATLYEHYIDGEEKHYIDALNFICRINGDDLLAEMREMLGI